MKASKLLKTTLKRVIGMAYSRTEFKNKVEEKIGGALFEYLKSKYTTANSETKWVRHWDSEVNRLLDTELVVVLLHTASFKNKQKAAYEVIDSLKNMVESYRKSARLQLEKNYFRRSLKVEIPEKKIKEFFHRVETIVTEHCG